MTRNPPDNPRSQPGLAQTWSVDRRLSLSHINTPLPTASTSSFSLHAPKCSNCPIVVICSHETIFGTPSGGKSSCFSLFDATGSCHRGRAAMPTLNDFQLRRLKYLLRPLNLRRPVRLGKFLSAPLCLGALMCGCHWRRRNRKTCRKTMS